MLLLHVLFLVCKLTVHVLCFHCAQCILSNSNIVELDSNIANLFAV